jgi:hypothetical protein
MSSREAHAPIKTAHRTAEYKQLTGYFHNQEVYYRAQAAD